MKNSFSHKQLITFALSTCALLSLSGCGLLDYFKFGSAQVEKIAPKDASSMTSPAGNNNVPAGQALVSCDGKPIMTKEQFEKDCNAIIDSQPQLRQIMGMMPDLEDKIFEGLLAQVIMEEYIAREKLHESEDYKKMMDDYIRQAKFVINDVIFSKQFSTDVSDAEVKAFYEENKNQIPELIISMEGVNTLGVSFDSQEAANEFAQKVKDKAAQFEKIAKESGHAATFRDFKLVNAQSVGLDPAVRNKVVSLKTFPSVSVVKGSDDKKVWVVAALNQEEPKYKDFEMLKEQLRAVVQQDKLNKAKDEKLESLKKEYNVVVEKDYFQQRKDARKSDRMEQLQEMMKQQQEAKGAKPQAAAEPVKQPRVA